MGYEGLYFGQLTLGDLIDWLEARDGRVELGFGEPMSYRGSYDELAFEPDGETTVAQMREYAKSAVGQVFQGYKGGDYLMTRETPVWIARYGESGEPIGRLTLKLWESQL